jgi:hypothetical protein
MHGPHGNQAYHLIGPQPAPGPSTCVQGRRGQAEAKCFFSFQARHLAPPLACKGVRLSQGAEFYFSSLSQFLIKA